MRLNSFRELGNLLGRTATMAATRQTVLHQIGDMVQDRAEAKFGTYQDGIIDYEEWEPLADSTQKNRERMGTTKDDPLHRPGIKPTDARRGSEHIKDTLSNVVRGNEVHIGSDNEVMPHHEYGTVHMVPRPVLGPALEESVPQILTLIGSTYSAALVHTRPRMSRIIRG